MIIRELHTDDYETVHELIKNEMEHPEVLFTKMSASLDDMKADNRYFLFVAEDNNQVVGFVSAVEMIGCIDSRYIEITCLVVSQNHQRSGIGTTLLEHIESMGKEKDIANYSVTSGEHRTGAHEFYRKNGFKDGGYVFYNGQVIVKKDQ